jgi:hypothetical protein
MNGAFSCPRFTQSEPPEINVILAHEGAAIVGNPRRITAPLRDPSQHFGQGGATSAGMGRVKCSM